MCQNVSDKGSLAWFKIQAKISSRYGVCVQGEWQKYTPPFPPLFIGKGLRDNGHSMSIANLILGVNNSVTISYLMHYDNLVQNAANIVTKCDCYFITKYDRSLLQNASGFLLQNETVLLQNATVITNCDDFITKCDRYNKMPSLLKIASVQLSCSLPFLNLTTLTRLKTY